jgi:predicted acylesterase/phospholipase RssA
VSCTWKSSNISKSNPVAGSELFDFVAGPSTGAIVATGLLLRDEDGRPRYLAGEMLSIYAQFGRDVLQAPAYHRILTLNGLLGPRLFNHTEIVMAHEVFGNNRFGDLGRPAMIPVLSVAKGRFMLLRNWVEPEANMLLGPLVAAATAAPTYFPAVRLNGHDDYAGVYADAAIVLNNPSHRAFVVALERYPDADFVVVSLGMETTRNADIWEGVNGGGWNWLRPILSVVFSGQDDINLSALDNLKAVRTSFELDGFRLAPEIPWTWDIMDGSNASIDRFRKAARDYVAENRDELDRILNLLKEDGSERSEAMQ